MVSPANSDSTIQPDSTWGWMNGQWMALSQLALPLNDFGVRQGVIAVERMRTYAGSLFAADRHLRRLSATAQALLIKNLPSDTSIQTLIDELLSRNAEFVVQQGDVGITVIATPGHRLDTASPPTLAIHLNVIDHKKMLQRQQNGQPLVITGVVQPPASSWSRQIKVRCRVHYYHADAFAREIHSDASGVLIDDDGSVTESSIANLAIVESGDIVSPEPSQVLHGVTQSVVQEIAAEQGSVWLHARLTPKRVLAADEILLMGTDGGLWWGWNALAEHPKRRDSQRPQRGKVYQAIRQRFDEVVTA